MSHVDDGTLHAYLDGELSPAEAQGIDAHLAQCPGCRARRDEERALIARADELLALAAPPLSPGRGAAPFQPGDLKPPARLWWRVRLPLAWAATVALALGTGWYLGGHAFLARAPHVAADAQLDSTARELAAPALAARAPQRSRAAPTPVPQHADTAAPQPLAGAAVPAPLPLAIERRAVRESVVAAPTAGGRAAAVSVRPSLVAGNAKEAAPSPPEAVPITLDSARRLLGQDPVALPGVPIRALLHERVIGAAVVVVEQALDSTAVITLRERRGAPGLLVSDAVAPRGERRDRRDSVVARAAAPPPTAAQVVEERGHPALERGDLRVEISGPLPADSLKRLLERVRPVKP